MATAKPCKKNSEEDGDTYGLEVIDAFVAKTEGQEGINHQNLNDITKAVSKSSECTKLVNVCVLILTAVILILLSLLFVNSQKSRIRGRNTDETDKPKPPFTCPQQTACPQSSSCPPERPGKMLDISKTALQ